MTTLPLPLLKVVGAVAVGLGLIGWSAKSVCLSPRASLLEQIESAEANVRDLERQISGRRDVDDRAATAVGRTLALEEDAHSARLRDGLARLAEQQGLAGVVVDHGRPQDANSPLLDVKGIQSGLKKELRKGPDFQFVRASLKGSGSLEQVVKAVALAQEQPWLARIEGVSIRPVGKARERFDLKLDVVTLLAPGLAPRKKGQPVEPVPTMLALSSEAESRAELIASRNLFKPITIAANEQPSTPEVIVVSSSSGDEPPRPQPFAAYEEWRLAGVAEGHDGTEAFFVNNRSGAKMTLRRGGQLLDAVLVEGGGEQIVLEIGGKRFEIRIGDTLAARRPLG